MMLPRLYAVTDENVVPNRRLIPVARQVLEAGVRMLQVRFKKTEPMDQVALGRKLRGLTSEYESLLIVNDSPELAKKIEADGVHLGADDPHVAYARGILGRDAIIGVSCYDEMERIIRWGAEDITYLGMATPYSSPTKKKVNPHLVKFTRLVSAARVPVFAIGGITPERVGEMMGAGCHGVAVVSAVFGAQNPGQAVKDFLAELARSKNT